MGLRGIQWAVGIGLLFNAASAGAARFIATPLAEMLQAGRLSLWQFGLYEARGPRAWRSLSRLDLGLAEGLEFGILVINPENKPSDTWVNLQYRPLKETGWIPSLAVGVWDAARKGPWFSDEKIGPSPFVSLSKTLQRGKRYARAGVSYGFNRLHGLFGGLELRLLDDVGLLAEYSPANLRTPGADAWNAGIYHWLGKHWRVRASWMGGNPMLDVFFAYSLGN